MPVTTQALVSREINVQPRLEEITLDNIRADEVLVEIHATGICHTDFSCMNGTLPAAFPSVLGHEGMLYQIAFAIKADQPRRRCGCGCRREGQARKQE